MFFDDEIINWDQFNQHEQELAESAFTVLADEITSTKKPKAFFIKGILLDNFIGYEKVSDEFKQAIADEIVHQWEVQHPEAAPTASAVSVETS